VRDFRLWPRFRTPVAHLEQSAPATPAAGDLYLYGKTDHRLYSKDSAGAETLIGAGAAGKTSALASSFNTYQPKEMLVLTDTFVADATTVILEIDVEGMTTGICHFPFLLYVGGANQAGPLHNGTRSSAVAGVTRYPLGSAAGGFDGRVPVHERTELTGLTVGATYTWELRTGATGYSNGITVTGILMTVLTPDDLKLYAIATSRVVPIAVGRELHDVFDATLSADDIASVPYGFLQANDAVCHPTATTARLYVNDLFGASIVVVDTNIDRPVSRLAAASYTPICLAISNDGATLYSGAGEGAIRTITTATMVMSGTSRNLPDTTFDPIWLALSPDGTKLAAVCTKASTNGRLVIFDTTSWSVLSNVDCGGLSPGKPAWESNTIIWVPVNETNLVRRFDTAAGTFSGNPITLIAAPRCCAITADKTTLFVAGAGANPQWAYFTLPSSSGSVPVTYDQSGGLTAMHYLTLSSDAYIYATRQTVGDIFLWQGGNIRIDTTAPTFWAEKARVRAYGGH
jgi:hypothetical protein